MKVRTVVSRAAVGGVAVAASVVGVSTPALAFAPDSFSVCYSVSSRCDSGYTVGTINWLNRTAEVSGEVSDSGAGSITAIFEAFAASNKIDTQTRSTDDTATGPTASPRGFTFAIGDPNLVGGINRVRITLCKNYKTASQSCTSQDNHWRD
jgi:hypothetical protein